MARRSAVLFLFVCAISFTSVAHADPVTAFIVNADSLSKLDDPASLREFVRENAILVGAVVGQLLDVAFEVEAELPGPAAENVDFAQLIADLHVEFGGSTVARGLVDRHRSWDATARATKRSAMATEAEADQLRRDGDPDRAVTRLETAAEQYRSIGDRRALAINAGTRGVAHWYRGDWPAVLESYDEALALRREIEDRILEGKTLNGQGSARFQQNLFEEALSWYERAIALRESTGDEVGLATSLNYAANCQQQLGRDLLARDLLERALPILEASGNPRKQIEVLHSVGLSYREMQRLDEAISFFDRALSLIEAAPEFEAGIRLDRGAALRYRGSLREALEDVLEVQRLVADDDDPFVQFRMHAERGLIESKLGEVEAAIEDLERAAEIARSLEVDEWVALAEANLAQVELERGNAEQALDLATAAYETAVAAGAEVYIGFAGRVVADALHELGRDEESLARTDAVLARFDDADPSFVASLRSQRANALAALGRYGAARVEFREVQTQFLRHGRQELEWIPLVGIADTFESLAPDSARVYYERALEVLESHRAAAGSGAVRTGYFSTQRGAVYEGITGFFAGQFARRGQARWSVLAFDTAERARARGLLELVQRSFDSDADPQLQVILDELYTLDENDPGLQEQRRSLQAELARRFDSYVETVAPLAARPGAVVRGPASVGAQLGRGDVALVYSIGETSSRLWAIDRDGHDLIELAAGTEIRDGVVALREALAVPGFGDAKLVEQARKLYLSLVEPAAARMRGKDRILIVPDGVLFDLPFELLLSDDVGKRVNWRRAPFLAKKFAITYTPSAAVWLGLRHETAVAASMRMIAIGDPDFTSLTPRAGMTGPLPALPEARVEIEAIAEVGIENLVALVGADATETALRVALDTAAPTILHLATHGLVDREDPSLTAIALGAGAGSTDDGYLHTLEVMTLPLDTELVVLSACDTGRGKLERGEGTIGLTRSFLAAGARRVVSSLWPVSDGSTSALMGEFYRQLLRKDQPVPEALNRARASLWKQKETAHPFYWAPFVLMGSDAPLPPGLRG